MCGLGGASKGKGFSHDRRVHRLLASLIAVVVKYQFQGVEEVVACLVQRLALAENVG